MELPAVDGETTRTESAAELLVRLTAESEAPITLLTLGPLSNVADAAELEPTAFAGRLAGIHAMAGTIDAPGNIEYGETSASDGVEWNVGADPDAMAEVLAMDVPITLVGLDASNQVPVPPDILERLGTDHAAAAADIVFEMYAKTPFLSAEGNSYWDPLAALTLTDPAANGKRVTVPKADVVRRSAGTRSLMPDGLANLLSDRQQFLDLARYLIEVAEQGPARAAELRPARAALVIPEYEKHVDHAGLIRSLDDRAYRRGEAIYARVCANCHGTNLRQLPNALLAGPEFVGRWGNRATSDLILQARSTMPPDNPGGLAPEAYTNVVAYLLEMSGGTPSENAIDANTTARVGQGLTGQAVAVAAAGLDPTGPSTSC